MYLPSVIKENSFCFPSSGNMIKHRRSLCVGLVLNKCKPPAIIQLIIQFSDFSEMKDLEDFTSLCSPKLGYFPASFVPLESKKGKLKRKTVHFSLILGLVTQ